VNTTEEEIEKHQEKPRATGRRNKVEEDKKPKDEIT
jgi:hypothetical protein